MKPDTHQLVREIAIQYPASVRVFESLGIDYCCGGKRSLEEACTRANVSPEEVMARIAASDGLPVEKNWAGAGFRALIEHIVERHHSYVRRESPRLQSMLAKVAGRHGAAHPELKSIQELFTALAGELFPHMTKEENILFPYLTRMEEAADRSAPLAAFVSVDAPIARMMADHENAGELLGRIRELSENYRLPDEACATYRALFDGLQEFERDLHEHIHLENNILFPAALQMERKEGTHVHS